MDHFVGILEFPVQIHGPEIRILLPGVCITSSSGVICPSTPKLALDRCITRFLTPTIVSRTVFRPGSVDASNPLSDKRFHRVFCFIGQAEPWLWASF